MAQLWHLEIQANFAMGKHYTSFTFGPANICTTTQNPPKLKLSQLKTVSLTKALKNPNSPFHACKPWLKHFNSAAKRHNLPPVLLASIAMQESESTFYILS